MRPFRTDRGKAPRWGAVFGAAVLAVQGSFLGPGAWAQAAPPPETSDGPLVLIPPPRDRDAFGDPAHERSPDSSGRSIVPPPPGSSDPAIEVGELGAAAEPRVGLITAETGGLGGDLWRGTPRLRIERLMARLEPASGSVAETRLKRVLLLSEAETPPGASDGASIYGLRLKSLYEAGLPDDVLALAEQAGGAGRDALAARAIAEASLALARTDEACLQVGVLDPAADAAEARAFAIRLNAFCQAVSGQPEAALLSAQLAMEEGGAGERFYALVAAAADVIPLDVTEIDRLDAVDFALFQAAGRPLPEGAAEAAEPGLWTVLAGDAIQETGVRVVAAERAAAAGLTGGKLLSELYEEAIVGAQGEGDQSPSEGTGGWERRAALYQAIFDDMDPLARAENLSALFASARRDGVLRAAALAVLPAFETVPPLAELLWFAPEAVYALTMADALPQAEAWRALMTASALSEEERLLAREADALYRIKSPRGRSEPALQDAFQAIEEALGAPAPETRRFAAFELSLTEALGADVPPHLWEVLIEIGPDLEAEAAADAPLRALDGAAIENRLGETVLLSLVAMERGGPGSTPFAAVTEIVTSLRSVGLMGHARAVAFEALAARSRLAAL